MYGDPEVLLPSPIQSSFSFSALTKNEYRDEDAPEGESRTIDGFLGYSEDGFIVNDGLCNVPSATASWAV
jgi:hypothetical protein